MRVRVLAPSFFTLPRSVLIFFLRETHADGQNAKQTRHHHFSTHRHHFLPASSAFTLDDDRATPLFYQGFPLSAPGMPLSSSRQLCVCCVCAVLFFSRAPCGALGAPAG